MFSIKKSIIGAVISLIPLASQGCYYGSSYGNFSSTPNNYSAYTNGNSQSDSYERYYDHVLRRTVTINSDEDRMNINRERESQIRNKEDFDERRRRAMEDAERNRRDYERWEQHRRY